MQTSVECAICFHTYNPHNKRPTILDCGHTFCLSCIKSLVEEDSVTCPKCRKISFNKTSEFATNFALLDVLEKTCGECLDQLWTNNCDHCQTNLCNQCSRKHKEESQCEVSQMLCDYREKIKIMEHESKNKKYLEQVEHKCTSEKSEVKVFWNNVQKKVQTKRNSDMKALAKQAKHKSSVHHKWQCTLGSSVCKAEASLIQYTETISKSYLTHREILTIKDDAKALLDSAEDIYSQQPSTADLDISLSSDKIEERLALSGVLGETSGGEELTGASVWLQDIFSLHQTSLSRFLKRPTIKQQTYWWLVALFSITVILPIAAFRYSACPVNLPNANEDVGQLQPEKNNGVIHDNLQIRSPVCDYNYSTTTYVKSVGQKGRGPGEFNIPYSVAVSPITGNIFVTDSGNSNIQIFTNNFQFISIISSGDTLGRIKMAYPAGITINSKGEIFISQPDSHYILVLDENRRWLNTITLEGLDSGNKYSPHRLSVDKDDNVYICDPANNRIIVMTADGTVIRQFGKHGTGSRPVLFMPWFITVSVDELVAVSDIDGHIYLFTTQGNHIRTIEAGQSGSFHDAKGITFDTDGNLIVADFQGGKLYVMTKEGEVVANIGSSGDDMIPLMLSHGIALTSDGYLVVCDGRNHQLHIFHIHNCSS